MIERVGAWARMSWIGRTEDSYESIVTKLVSMVRVDRGRGGILIKFKGHVTTNDTPRKSNGGNSDDYLPPPRKNSCSAVPFITSWRRARR